jgi:hypothetical protein
MASIFRFFLSRLLMLNNPLADIPISANKDIVNRAKCLLAPISE